VGSKYRSGPRMSKKVEFWMIMALYLSIMGVVLWLR